MKLNFENSDFAFKPVTRLEREAIKKWCWEGKNVQYFPLLPVSLIRYTVLHVII